MTTPQQWAVGIDLSLTSTGVAAYDMNSGTLHAHRVKSSSNGMTLDAKLERYTSVVSGITNAVYAANPCVVAIEGAQFSTSKDRSAHRRAGVWWAVVRELTAHGIPVVEVAPSVLKKWATGKGNADKDSVLAAAARKWAGVTGNDEADAAWLAEIAAYAAGSTVIPKTNMKDALIAKTDTSTL